MASNDAQHIEELFRERGVLSGRELLVDWKTALEIVETCRELGVGILGLDFYRNDESGITEVDCRGADFSDFFRLPDGFQLSVAAALRLLSNELPDNADYVSFVLKSPHSE